jgi:hypothetical protein
MNTNRLNAMRRMEENLRAEGRQSRADNVAELISAAEHLLAALTDLLAMCERQDDFNDDGDGGMFERCYAVIDRTTGEQPCANT